MIVFVSVLESGTKKIASFLARILNREDEQSRNRQTALCTSITLSYKTKADAKVIIIFYIMSIKGKKTPPIKGAHSLQGTFYRLGLPALPLPLPNLGTAIVGFLLLLPLAPRLTLLPWPPPSEGVPTFLPSFVSIISIKI